MRLKLYFDGIFNGVVAGNFKVLLFSYHFTLLNRWKIKA
jgi:hypothetical protein